MKSWKESFNPYNSSIWIFYPFWLLNWFQACFQSDIIVAAHRRPPYCICWLYKKVHRVMNGSNYNMLGGTSERICKRKQFCVWNVQLYSSAENAKETVQWVHEMKRYSCVNMADWPKTRPTATPRGPSKMKISQTEKSRQLTLSWWSKCYILNNLRVLHHIICWGN
jgi:hypothetical protein